MSGLGDAEWKRIQSICRTEGVSIKEAKRILAERDRAVQVSCPVCGHAMTKAELKNHARSSHGVNVNRTFRPGKSPEGPALYKGRKRPLEGGAPGLGKGKS
jgi:hypothetical protein